MIAARSLDYYSCMGRFLRIGVVVAAVFAAACGPSDPLEVSAIQLGKAINPDKTVAAFATRFAPTDTIYLVVLNAKPGKGTLGVKWMFGSRVVSEGTKQVSYTDAAATEFHLQNASGFPAGSYRVEVFLDGRSVGIRDYRVEYD